MLTTVAAIFTPVYHNHDVDNDDDENFQQVFKAKLWCQVKPIAPSGARLGSSQANANHHIPHHHHADHYDDDGLDDVDQNGDHDV